MITVYNRQDHCHVTDRLRVQGDKPNADVFECVVQRLLDPLFESQHEPTAHIVAVLTGEDNGYMQVWHV